MVFRHIFSSIIFTCVFSATLVAQADCTKLTGSKSGASGNGCCKTLAAQADDILIQSQLNDRNEIMLKHAPFGLPKTKNKAIIVLYAPNYICGYDTILHVPIWVQYKMEKASERQDDLSRINCFRPDLRLNENQRITHADYTHSGFDRGHLLPANDAKKDSISHINTFVMTNMAPQYANVNQKEWLMLESYLGSISRSDSVSEAYMITGSIVKAGCSTIDGKVAIPASFYKIFFFKVGTLWRYWNYYVINDSILKDINEFEKELVDNFQTIDELESQTGVDFKVCKKKIKMVESSQDVSHIYEGVFFKGYASTY